MLYLLTGYRSVIDRHDTSIFRFASAWSIFIIYYDENELLPFLVLRVGSEVDLQRESGFNLVLQNVWTMRLLRIGTCDK